MNQGRLLSMLLVLSGATRTLRAHCFVFYVECASVSRLYGGDLEVRHGSKLD